MEKIINNKLENNIRFFYAKILVLLIKLLLLLNEIFVLLKSVRLNNHNNLKKLISNIFLKVTKQEIEKIELEYKDYYIFSLFFPLGDFAIACSLIKTFKEQTNSKVIVIVNDKNRAELANLFPSIDKIMIVHPFLYNWIYENPQFELVKGKIYEINHWKFYNAPNYDSKNFLELYSNMLGLTTDCTKIEPPKFNNQITKNIDNFIRKNNIKCDKTVILFPLSNSFKCSEINETFWIDLANKLTQNKYNVLINSPKHKWNGFKTIFLPISEQLYFCSLCKMSISVRAGFNDVLGLMNLDNIIVLYPNTMFFNTISKIVQLCEFKRCFFDEQDKSFSENMYRITSLKMFNRKYKDKEIIYNANDSKLIDNLLTKVCA